MHLLICCPRVTECTEQVKWFAKSILIQISCTENDKEAKSACT